MSLPIGSLEGYLLSRIDGQVSLAELVDLVGLPRVQVEDAIGRLTALGAIVMEEPRAPAARDSAVSSRMPRPAAPAAAAAPAEAVDLSPERCKAVLETFAKLDRLTHYELLAIPDTADKGEVRSAYFALSKLVHPDTMYGKQLGSYKPKMEAIFKRATEAYDTLSKRKRREAYDEALGLEPLSARIEKAPKPPADAVSSPIASSPATPSPATPPASPPPSSTRTSSVRPRPPSSEIESRPVRAPASAQAQPDPPPRVSSRPPDDPIRRHAQQRVLQQIAQMTGRPSSSTPPSTRPSGPPSSRDSLLRGLASSLREANRFTSPDRIDKHLRAARTAEREGDLVGAANAFRLAHEACPDREDVASEYRRLRQTLAKMQAESFEKQATREERMELWGAAAISWSRVAEGRPDDGAAHRRAAYCLWRSNGDLKRARDLAMRAVELSGEDVEARITLGRIYQTAGMKLNARRELEAAAKLDPKDEIVKNLLRELKS